MTLGCNYTGRTVCTAAIVFGAVHAFALTGSQGKEESHVIKSDYAETVLRFSASNSDNSSFLVTFDGENVSRLEVGGRWSSGKLVNYFQSDNRLDFGVSASSIYRINPRMVLSGGISYAVDKGKNMSGSAFINPYEAPFDIVEATDDNAGTKRHESYMLEGGLGFMLTDRFSVGGMLAYSTENYAKFKDLRHQNALMKMDLSVGISYKVYDMLLLGMAYTYYRRLETLFFKVYGNTDRQYFSLISFGGFYGRTELFGESGYTSETTPLFTQKHGGALQVFYDGGRMKWFNEMSFRTLSGRFGSGSSASITYSLHEGYDTDFESKLTIDGSGMLHSLELNASYTLLENNENSYKKTTDQSGVSQIIYYGSNKVGEKSLFRAVLDYRLLYGNNKNRSDWNLWTSLGYMSRALTASLYPFYRTQNMNAANISMSISKNIYSGKNVYTVGLASGFSSGWGDMNTDGTYTETVDDQKHPSQRDDLLVKEFDYVTSSQIFAGLLCGYEREIRKSISAYIKADFSYRRALNTSLEGAHNKMAGLHFGVKF